MITLGAADLTVEYGTGARHQDGIQIVPFPNVDPDDGRTMLIVGTVEELRGVVDTMSRMLDDLEES